MTRTQHASSTVFLIVAGLIAAGGTARAAEKFAGRIMTGGRFNSPAAIGCRIEIDKYSDPQQIIEFTKILDERGYEAFMKAFRETNLGSIQITGERGLNVTIHATNSTATDSGRRIQLFSEKQTWDVQTTQRLSGQYLFMVIELDVDAEGKGNGRLYPAAQIEMDSEGKIQMKSYDAAPKVIFGLKRTT